MWLLAACFSAFFAGITSILAKCGIKKMDSDVATAVRTSIVLALSWLMVFVAGSAGTVTRMDSRSLIFLILSGLSTGASWICYFRALSVGDINKVVPIDKSSTVLSVLLAVIVFGETGHLAVKLAGTAVLALGIFLMIEKKESIAEGKRHGSWFAYAVFSSVFASLTAILARVGIAGVESNLGTAIRTSVVLVMAWGIVFFKGKHTQIKTIDKTELFYLSFSGLATGVSWLCYYYAIQNGIVSVVVPVDKLSIVITVVFSYIAFKEKLTRRAGIGLCLMAAGTLAMAIWA